MLGVLFNSAVDPQLNRLLWPVEHRQARLPACTSRPHPPHPSAQANLAADAPTTPEKRRNACKTAQCASKDAVAPSGQHRCLLLPILFNLASSALYACQRQRQNRDCAPKRSPPRHGTNHSHPAFYNFSCDLGGQNGPTAVQGAVRCLEWSQGCGY